MSNPPPPPGAPPPPPGANPPGAPPPPPGQGPAAPTYGPAAHPAAPPATTVGPAAGGPQPPPGYVAYGTPLQMRSALEGTGGLRVATTILVWVATAGSGLQLLAVINRRSVWNDPSSSFGDLVDADDTVAGAFLLYAVAALATAIVLSIWTLRAVRNSQKLGTTRLRPGLACGGWYIPFGNVVVPFIQIRRATAGLGASTVSATLWQAGWAAMVVGGTIVNTAINDTNAFDPDAVSEDLSLQVTGAAVTFVAAVIAAAGATFAMRRLDAAVAQRVEA